MVKRLNYQSSPGWPYCREAPTVGEWLKYDGLKYDAYQLQRLWFDVQCVLKGDFDHVFKVFVKQEPHKPSKVQEGRWRLIIAASLPVQCAWHMLFDFQNDLEIDEAYKIPSQQGIIFPGGGWKSFYRQWESSGYTHGVDMNAWDWTVPGWVFLLELEFRKRMGSGRRMAEWLNIAKVLYRDAFCEAKLLLTDGTVWKQVHAGIMKSGVVNTISTNSHGGAIVHISACYRSNVDPWPLPKVVGDDKIVVGKHLDLDYGTIGVKPKPPIEAIEFVGHVFRESGPLPVYTAKHLANFTRCSVGYEADYLDAMARMYAHSDLWSLWEDLAYYAGFCFPSRESCLYWYDVDGY